MGKKEGWKGAKGWEKTGKGKRSKRGGAGSVVLPNPDPRDRRREGRGVREAGDVGPDLYAAGHNW